MRDRLRQELTIAALSMGIQRQRPGRGLLHHFDRGSMPRRLPQGSESERHHAIDEPEGQLLDAAMGS